MFTSIKKTVASHVKQNRSIYLALLIAFIIGVTAGAFTVNGLTSAQTDELTSYFQGFIQLLDNQNVDSNELLAASFVENGKLVVILWLLGITIIGIPLIYLFMAVKGFICGFSIGFLIAAAGMKGLLFSIFAILPREIIIVPCLIAIGVNGINFSLKMIKSKPVNRISGDSLKKGFFSYSFVTLVYSSFIIAAILLDAFIIPVFVRMISSGLT